MYIPPVPSVPLAFLNSMFGVDGLVVLIIGLLIFGRRLPEMGTNLRRSIREARGETDPASFAVYIFLALRVLFLLFYLASHLGWTSQERRCRNVTIVGSSGG